MAMAAMDDSLSAGIADTISHGLFGGTAYLMNARVTMIANRIIANHKAKEPPQNELNAL